MAGKNTTLNYNGTPWRYTSKPWCAMLHHGVLKSPYGILFCGKNKSTMVGIIPRCAYHGAPWFFNAAPWCTVVHHGVWNFRYGISNFSTGW